MRSRAAAMLAAVCVCGTAIATAIAQDGEILLRKSFAPPPPAAAPASTPAGSAGSEASSPGRGGVSEGRGSAQGEGLGERAAPRRRPAANVLRGLFLAIGETVVEDGELVFPLAGSAGPLVLRGAEFPTVELASGARLVLDAAGSLEPSLATAVGRNFPGWEVSQPGVDMTASDAIAEALARSGYASVRRDEELVVGGGATVRIRADFVVAKRPEDLLGGTTWAVRVRAPGAPRCPPELGDAARGRRIEIVEIEPDGTALPVGDAPWRDPSGRLTLLDTDRPSFLLAEIGDALGLSVERDVEVPSAGAAPPVHAALRLSLDDASCLVFDDAPPPSALDATGGCAILARGREAGALVAEVLEGLSIPHFGPAVDFSLGVAGRFTVRAPGWLAQFGGRRVLITDAGLSAPLRDLLTRNGYDILDFHIQDGRR